MTENLKLYSATGSRRATITRIDDFFIYFIWENGVADKKPLSACKKLPNGDYQFSTTKRSRSEAGMTIRATKSTLLPIGEMFEWMDGLKKAYYILEDMKTAANELVMMNARNCQRILDEVITEISEKIKEDPEHMQVYFYLLKPYIDIEKGFWCVNSSTKTCIKNYLYTHEEDDVPFWENHGDFWNEVYLPDSIVSLLTAVIDTVKGQFEGMMGMESAYVRGEGIPDTAAGVSLYDLSDTLIVFDTKENADKFFMKELDEPSYVMCWNGYGWCS